MRRPALALALAGLGITVAHAGPALTAIAPFRRVFAPGLSGPGAVDHVAITFDDGPDAASTPHFLRLLAARGVHATFFLLGRSLVSNPGLGRDLVAAGHELGVHGFDHRCLLARGHRATYGQLARTKDIITDISGTPPRWYRPPYGVLTASALRAARRLDMVPVLWTRWGKDWTAKATPASVLDMVTPGLVGGATILLHDSDCTSAPGSWRATLGAVPSIIDTCRERGLRVGPLREHFD
jgi:peptidoglycan/xylan/chitin deacetylase (PgdA/CDA1 family)